MQPFETTPTSAAKRLGVSLNLDTGYKRKVKASSPPQTPETPQDENHPPTRSKAAAAHPAPNILSRSREMMGEESTPADPANQGIDNSERLHGDRDSHDLALGPEQVTRDSLVDHMLFSLDQLSDEQHGDWVGRQPVRDAQLYSAFADADEDAYQPAHHPARRGAGHNYSYNSDFEAADDASRHSGGPLSGARRSNSGSNFPANLGRINSVRNEGSATFDASQLPTPQQLPPQGRHSRGKGSKGSSVISCELGHAHIPSSQPWAHGLDARSPSVDYGSDRAAMGAPFHAASRPAETPAPSFHPYDYDAAPTPTVPAGPRRVRAASPIRIPAPDLVPAEPPHGMARKRSTRSSKSGYKGRHDDRPRDHSRELPPLPAMAREPAAAPGTLPGHGRPQAPTPPGPAPLRDRPGFFRRVFGSRSTPVVPADAPPSHGSTTSAETTDRPPTRTQHVGTQIKPQHANTPREAPPPPREQAHVLTKKPSSFFRRRKKSVTEPEPTTPPVPRVALQPADGKREGREPSPSRASPSPVSSLRIVMNPYLKTSVRNPTGLAPPHDAASRPAGQAPAPPDRAGRGFSPDYEPEKSATIRAVRPSDREPADRGSPAGPRATPSSTAGRTGPGPGRDVREGPSRQDGGDNDPETRAGPRAVDRREKNWLADHQIPSPSVAREMALVADYASAHAPAAATPDPTGPSPVAGPPRRPAESEPHIQHAEAGPRRDEEWVMLTPTNPPEQTEEGRVRLEASSSEEDLADCNPALPLECKMEASSRVSGSTDTVYKSATSLPALHVEGTEELDPPPPPHRSPSPPGAVQPLDGPRPPSDGTVPSDQDREKARNIYDGHEDFTQKDKAAAWLGEDNPARLRVLVAYLDLYDFSSLNILAALRLMCGRLVLKAESQQVDRILVTFAKRWCACNPDHGFKGHDVVHTICYSLLLLNTDLHLADIDQKMTRSQFVKNTMPTVRRSVADLAPDAFESARPTILPGRGSAFDSTKPADDGASKSEGASLDMERPAWRMSFKPPPRADADGIVPTPLDYDPPADDCGPLVKAPFHGSLRTWEVQVEIVLKDFYNSIRSDRLPLFGSSAERPVPPAPSSNSLSVFTNGVLRRTPSVLSKSPSESQSHHGRGRAAETVRVGNGKWASKNRSRPRLYPSSAMSSSRTSLDDQSSMWSPSVSSSTWSKYSTGKTHASMSVDSFGSGFPHGDYQQSIGFANALSQAIIREETIGSAGSTGSERGDGEEPRAAPLLEDESLELHGAPWAKEGIVKHKHHLEAVDKRSKDRNWSEVFAVIEKGYMSLFSFSSKTLRKQNKGKAALGTVVGGGNWQENAHSHGSFLLRQTIASALPSPGYSKARPHVWALSLPSGAVHLFQVGTPDIVREFVSSANYWSARLSNHPLVGGISNIEYGWSDAIVHNSLVHAIGESTRPSSSGNRASLQSSLRSSLDHAHGGGFRPRLPGDKITISDWSPPTQSMRASNLMEADQLRSLSDYVASIEEELQKHNQLRSPMLLAFTPRHPNAQRAMANWERKSSYLLREIVKFRTYIDCLVAAESGKQKIYAERAEQHAIGVDEDDDEGDVTLRPE
ncbi:unnamed protein product [Diplocarpon coronariae]